MAISDQQRELRNALGSFATGVTVVTTAQQNGSPEGMTVNSFSSVSLAPPLVLWSIDKNSSCFDTFIKAGHFAVHVLTQRQQTISNNFASRENNKFDDIDWYPDNDNTPLLANYAARFICSMEHQYEGGDHIILVGRVEEFDQNSAKPLLFHSGRYKKAAELVSS